MITFHELVVIDLKFAAIIVLDSIPEAVSVQYSHSSSEMHICRHLSINEQVRRRAKLNYVAVGVQASIREKI